jgi:hypothetical protein
MPYLSDGLLEKIDRAITDGGTKIRGLMMGFAVFDISLVKASGFGCRRRKLAQREIEPFEAN